MFFTHIEDPRNHKLVGFYCVFTNSYFGLLFTILHFTETIYMIGKYEFLPVILIMVAFETVKFFIGQYYFSKKKETIIGRPDGSHKKIHGKSKTKEVLKCIGVLLGMLIVYYIIAVLFGAQLFSHQEETLMLSVLLCTLTIYPICINLGSQSVANLVFNMKPNNSDLMSFYLSKLLQFTVFGSWLGAFVIPLDWDRPWQEWPISCCIGASAGFLAANVLVLGRVYSAQLAMNKVARKAR